MKEKYLKECLREVEHKVASVPRHAPAQRELAKQKYSFSGEDEFRELEVWDYIWNHSEDFWVKIQAFLFCESKVKNADFLIAAWDTIKRWQESVDSWGSCDALSKIYTKILELIPEQVLPQLEQWNRSTHMWDKRQSIVSLLYFSRTKKVFLPYETIIPFINRLICDKAYYVQKAVGWGLKELYHVYPLETYQFLEKNIEKVSAVAFGAATEKLKKEEKARLKMMRI